MAILDIGVCADESGIHDGASICVLSGYIGSLKQWCWFEDAWDEVLDKYDVLDFHSKEFFAVIEGKRVGHYYRRSKRNERLNYSDWSDEQTAKFLDELLDIIDSRNVSPVGASVEVPAFWALSYGERRFVTGGHFHGEKFITSGAPTKPYFLMFDHCLVDSANKTKEGKRIVFVFDQQKQYESRAIEQFGESVRLLDKPMAEKFGGVMFQPRIDAPGLQAADLYTHCWHRYQTDRKTVGELRLRALDVLTKKAIGMPIYNAAHFETMLRQLPLEIRAKIHEFKDPNEKSSSCPQSA